MTEQRILEYMNCTTYAWPSERYREFMKTLVANLKVHTYSVKTTKKIERKIKSLEARDK